VRVGVVGGGQLARMMIPAALNLGIDLCVLAENPGSAARLAVSQLGDYRDLETVLAFARTVDVVTFDHEHVPQSILRELVAQGHRVHPGPDALLFAQDKALMRKKLAEIGIPVPAWASVRDSFELHEFIDEHGGRAVVKTVRGGYDGKGVRLVSSAGEVDDWFRVLTEEGPDGVLLVEEFVEFRRELAQLIARRPSGEVALWPVVETIQQHGVCTEVFAPAPDSSGKITEVAAELAVEIAEKLDVTGVLAVELFETVDDRLLVNELAMRPHNSGHWTIEGSTTSQFEQHLRAVLDLPLGDTGCLAPWSVMVNVLGGSEPGVLTDRYPQALKNHPSVKVHNYGKESRPGRKVGHVTASGAGLEEVVFEARAVAALLGSTVP